MISADNENFEQGGAIVASRFWSCFLDEWQVVVALGGLGYCVVVALYALTWVGAVSGLVVAIAAGAGLTYTIRRLLKVVSAPATVHEISESVWRRVAS